MFDILKKVLHLKSQEAAPVDGIAEQIMSDLSEPSEESPAAPSQQVEPDFSGLLHAGPRASKPEIIPLPAQVAEPEEIDWAEEARTDLPPRTPERISFLLRFEDTNATARRIANDHERYRRLRAGIAVGS